MKISDIEAVVICITDERKRHMEKQTELFPFSTLFFKGYTPSESVSYINCKHPVYPEKDTTLCCTRSHIHALKYFLEHSDKQIALILEDDVLFSKQFISKLTNVLELWNMHKTDIDYVSIGYAPSGCKSIKCYNELYWDLNCEDGDVWGTLGYLVTRSVAEDIVHTLDQPNTSILVNAIINRIKLNQTIFSPKNLRLQSDVIMSLCWKQAFIKPMLVIESPQFNSTIVPENKNSISHGWNSIFKSGELNINDFDEICAIYKDSHL